METLPECQPKIKPVTGFWSLVTGCWMLDARCSMLDTGYWGLVTGGWKINGVGFQEFGSWNAEGGK
jgi:hypothetical protein